ncbi:MAG: tRNA (adenosine(37)-N6)-threonylcarbamoyltransferase complex transferase subunit TsaD [Rhodocyclaceae bacterium]|nr:tRNA (adenosine(37)-N6)-threonylcarbamoyltransferase complex transferase subunit TsaD [Rhodocyclaceae bacterium]MBX3667666.1 tRNA (adenosine(37)-N6)-threonylcarbamoyltransferase complex transferase subunit TsaD [Rhodocyclaceae bacterium]
MLVLGIESSCDETGVALFDTARGLLAHALHSQIDLHQAYGGVVPELASRDHIRRIVPLYRDVLQRAQVEPSAIDAVGYTAGPGLAGALLVGAAFAEALALALGRPACPIHHLEGHLLSPLLADPAPCFPFVALLVSGGHTQLMAVAGVGRYRLLGETVDDAAGEAFDKTAKVMGLPYPGGPQLARLAQSGRPGRYRLPRPMLHSGDLDFSFSGLKTAVLTQVARGLDGGDAADLAAEFQEAVVDVLVAKACGALRQAGLGELVVAGGVGANQRLRERLDAACARMGAQAFYPPLDLCTDNGAMIAFACAQRLQAGRGAKALPAAFRVFPRWPLANLVPPG